MRSRAVGYSLAGTIQADVISFGCEQMLGSANAAHQHDSLRVKCRTWQLWQVAVQEVPGMSEVDLMSQKYACRCCCC